MRDASRTLVTLLLTTLAMLAFAANSILCRLALGGRAIDAASFALIRLGSGAAMLLLIQLASRRARPTGRGWLAPVMLFSYATAFSLAYVSLGAGSGALILFGSVQATMILSALVAGERFRPMEGIGFALALAGLAYLVSPGLTAPAPIGSALMATAGIAWGIYSLQGRGSTDALGDTARNFLAAIPLGLVVGLLAFRNLHVSPRGALLAVMSGALTSGLGYVVWFAALRNLSAIRAATVQLSVPALAAAGGVLLLGERVSLRLVASAALILGGVGLAVAGRRRPVRESAES